LPPSKNFYGSTRNDVIELKLQSIKEPKIAKIEFSRAIESLKNCRKNLRWQWIFSKKFMIQNFLTYQVFRGKPP